EVEARDDVQRLQVGEVAVVDDLHERAAPVEEAQHAVHLVRELGEPVGELAVVDLEDGLERGELLEQAAPLVEAPHALHEQPLRRELDDVAAPDVLELDLELAVGPDEEAVDRILALEPPELGVDDLAVAEVDGRAPVAAREVNHARLAADLDGLDQIDHRHVAQRAGELGPGFPLLLERGALLLLEQDLDAGDDLLDVDRL